MGLGEYVDSLYKKCKRDTSSGEKFWDKFEKDPRIACFNRYLSYTLYSRNIELFKRELNSLSYEEASKLVRISHISNHEILFIEATYLQ